MVIWQPLLQSLAIHNPFLLRDQSYVLRSYLSKFHWMWSKALGKASKWTSGYLIIYFYFFILLSMRWMKKTLLDTGCKDTFWRKLLCVIWHWVKFDISMFQNASSPSNCFSFNFKPALIGVFGHLWSAMVIVLANSCLITHQAHTEQH